MSATSDIEVLKLELRPFVKRSVTTGPGNAGGTTLVDATLVEAAGFWNDCLVLLRTGTYAGELRRVTASIPGTLTLDHTVGGQIVAAIQYVMLAKIPVNVVAGGGLKADLQQVLGQHADIAPGNELLTDLADRAARLVGIVYGSEDQLQQVAGTLELITRITGVDEGGVSRTVLLTEEGKVLIFGEMDLADSTDTPLDVDATYTSASFATEGYEKIVGTCIADAPGTLYVEQSQDNVNWDLISPFPVNTDPNNRGAGFEVEVVAPYGRVRYVNLGTAQTEFRLFTHLKAFAGTGNRVEPRKTTRLMHNAVDLTADDTDYPSEELDCVPYSKFVIMYDITETGTLVNGDRIRIRVQFREPGGTWRDLANGPFGALYEEESTTPCNFAVNGDCVGEKMRITVTTDYTNADPTSNYFTITAKVTLME